MVEEMDGRWVDGMVASMVVDSVANLDVLVVFLQVVYLVVWMAELSDG